MIIYPETMPFLVLFIVGIIPLNVIVVFSAHRKHPIWKVAMWLGLFGTWGWAFWMFSGFTQGLTTTNWGSVERGMVVYAMPLIIATVMTLGMWAWATQPYGKDSEEDQGPGR